MPALGSCSDTRTKEPTRKMKRSKHCRKHWKSIRAGHRRRICSILYKLTFIKIYVINTIVAVPAFRESQHCAFQSTEVLMFFRHLLDVRVLLLHVVTLVV